MELTPAKIISLSALVTAIGAIWIGADRAWDMMHQNYPTNDTLKVLRIEDKVDYHDTRLKEYEATPEEKRDATWVQRSTVQSTKLDMFCGDLSKEGIKNRVCDKR